MLKFQPEPKYRFIPDRNPLFRPACPTCGKLMLLSRIEPDEPSHELRTFKCLQCRCEETELVRFK
jgi:hypothetical protein